MISNYSRMSNNYSGFIRLNSSFIREIHSLSTFGNDYINYVIFYKNCKLIKEPDNLGRKEDPLPDYNKAMAREARLPTSEDHTVPDSNPA